MGPFVLKGITTALLVTVLTLFAGIVWGAMGLGGLSVSRLLDIGLLASCLIGGYRTAKESGVWLLGGATGAGYVTVGTLLLALFLPIRGLGFVQILAEGVIIGLVAGAVGAGGTKGVVSGTRRGRRSNAHYTPAYGGYGSDTDDQDGKFEWDTEEKLQVVENEPISNWIDSAEDERQETRGVKRNLEESQEVEWSWDREDNKNLLSSGTGFSEPPRIREPDPVWADVYGGNRASANNLSEGKVGGRKPWWEE
ncbi:TIGR04086 family membrane protein [Desulfosporosinus metallidurans]|uniref:Uncharacterized protein n=1 Tax=Desulfosporosinus metallidurans TaxID=1888891 RepID=A0A1Q8QX45_9FIRM|nr:TIGR04086 family membrane protein [Desulfosporosinus metallidurans]OLN31907.1 hypothetical protein DSOL_2202 [Desulfosporosinus metallidurans]